MRAGQLRAAALLLADWLEHRAFRVIQLPGQDIELCTQLAEAWAQGYRRAIYELRAGATVPAPIPDDISELDGDKP